MIRVVAPVLHPRVRSLTFRPDPPRLYALTEAGDEIVVIDPVTGHLPTKFRIHGFPVLDAIEWDEVHRELRGVSRADHVLVRVDPLTGETVPLLAIDPAFDLVALAVRPWDGILIGLDVLQNRLVRIDVEQGEIVELAPLAEDQARGLSAGPDGLVVLSRPEEGTETDVLPVADAIDEATLADLAGDLEIELGAFEEPERHRGGGTDAAATLLWPRRDVRPEGLSTYAIEVDDAYGAGGALAHLEFRKGGETLWRDEKPFDPAGAVAIGRVPAEVLRRAGVGDTVTWGLFYDAKARRKDVRADFRLVRDAATEKQLERVARDPELERRVPLARGVLAGLVYQNHGLHSESLVHHVRLAVANPHSLRPLWGIVVALRRLDLTESQLWVTVVEPVLRAPGASTAAARRAPLLDATGLRTLGLYGRAGGTPKSSAAIPAAKPPK